MVGSITQNNNLNTAPKYGVENPIPVNQGNISNNDMFKDFYSKNPVTMPPKGKLVEGHKLSNNVLKEYSIAAKNFYKALKGEGGDYEVGKLNDSAVKLGSLAIAALLSSKAASPIAKTMEFVGFGTWFLAMSLWPKFFIGKPIKALTGVDINQEYIDSYGRRKSQPPCRPSKRIETYY